MEASPISSSEMEADCPDTLEISPISSSDMEADCLDTLEILSLSSSSEMEADCLDTLEILSLSSSSEMEADCLDTMEKSQISYSEIEAACPVNLMGIALNYVLAGDCAIQTTGLSNSVPPLVMSLFKHCFALFTFYSIYVGFSSIIEPNDALQPLPVNISSTTTLAVKFLNYLLSLFAYSSLAIHHFFPIGVYVFAIPLPLFLLYQSFFRTHWLNLVRRVLDSSSLDPFTTWLQIYMSAHDQRTKVLLPWTTNAAAATGREIGNNKKIMKTIKFAVGITGSFLFQKYFKLNSFDKILAFLYYAVAWLANISLLSVMDDFGVFNFLIGNVLGSTMTEAGFGYHTWIALAASLFLYRLRLELKSILGRLNNVVTISIMIIFYYGYYLVPFTEGTCPI